MYLDDIVETEKYESFKMETKARLNRSDIIGWLKHNHADFYRYD